MGALSVRPQPNRPAAAGGGCCPRVDVLGSPKAGGICGRRARLRQGHAGRLPTNAGELVQYVQYSMGRCSGWRVGASSVDTRLQAWHGPHGSTELMAGASKRLICIATCMTARLPALMIGMHTLTREGAALKAAGCRRRRRRRPQCELLAKDFGVPFFSAGELIRAHIESGSAEGKRLQDIILNGHIIPSEVRVNERMMVTLECSIITYLLGISR